MTSEHTVAAVSFLNARPLIEGIAKEPGVRLITDVPSRLLDTLTEGRASVALCPVIDFQLSAADLTIVPTGAIGSDGTTLTVRVYSRTPLNDVVHVQTDGDSHTSVALLTVVFEALFGRRPELDILEAANVNGVPNPPEAVLLIGDKVVRNEPNPDIYTYQLDLGAAWKDLTGLPFVFACWMARADQELGHLPDVLSRCRDVNRERTAEIAADYAAASGWPEDLAASYLGEVLRYDLGPSEFEAIELFWERCHTLGLINRLRPIRVYDGMK